MITDDATTTCELDLIVCIIFVDFVAGDLIIGIFVDCVAGDLIIGVFVDVITFEGIKVFIEVVGTTEDVATK